jgi:hypothetical protein
MEKKIVVMYGIPFVMHHNHTPVVRVVHQTKNLSSDRLIKVQQDLDRQRFAGHDQDMPALDDHRMSPQGSCKTAFFSVKHEDDHYTGRRNHGHGGLVKRNLGVKPEYKYRRLRANGSGKTRVANVI